MILLILLISDLSDFTISCLLIVLLGIVASIGAVLIPNSIGELSFTCKRIGGDNLIQKDRAEWAVQHIPMVPALS